VAREVDSTMTKEQLISLPRFLPPVRTHVGADRPALGTHHAQPERRHREITRQKVYVEDQAVVGLDSSDRTPFWRMFATSIGSIGSLVRDISSYHADVLPSQDYSGSSP
jgi:hypothetical protein